MNNTRETKNTKGSNKNTRINSKFNPKLNQELNQELNTKGVTLVELLLYMGLLSILLVVLTDILVAALNLGLGAKAYSAVENDGRYIISRITYDIKRAEEIVFPAGEGDEEDSLELIIFDQEATYEINASNLRLINQYGTNNLNGSDTVITDITFTRFEQNASNPSIKVDVTVESVASNNTGKEVQTFSSTITKR